MVIYLSLGGVLLLSWLVIKYEVPDKRAETTKYVFGTLLPLLGTWVGTILAYYFSMENLAAATQSVTDLAKTVTAMDKLRAVLVRDKMRPLAKSIIETVKPGDETNVKLVDLLNSDYSRDTAVDCHRSWSMVQG